MIHLFSDMYSVMKCTCGHSMENFAVIFDAKIRDNYFSLLHLNVAENDKIDFIFIQLKFISHLE